MQAVILAGGFGTRISEESYLKPKPMIEIGSKPIIWHIMKIFSHYKINDFIICCGYKGYLLKEYFSNYFLHNSDVTFNLGTNTIEINKKNSEDWKVTLIDTGLNTLTGGRIKRIKEYITEDNFCLTYGDGLSDINISKLIEFHYSQKKDATLTAVQPAGRFGVLKITNQNEVQSFQEKPTGDGGWVNGGFFILNKSVINNIEDDNTIWEKEPLINLAKNNNLAAFKHKGFWHPMDTLRDKNYLEDLWNSSNPPWKIW
mgnify:CR=1 FL=1